MPSQKHDISWMDVGPPEVIGVYTYDIARGLVFSNERVAAYFNLRPLAIGEGYELDRYMLAVVPDDRDRLMRAIEASFRSGELRIDYRVASDVHGVRHIQAVGNCYRDAEGRPLIASGYLEDISGSDQALQSSRLLDLLRQSADQASGLRMDFVTYMIETIVAEVHDRTQ